MRLVSERPCCDRKFWLGLSHAYLALAMRLNFQKSSSLDSTLTGDGRFRPWFLAEVFKAERTRQRGPNRCTSAPNPHTKATRRTSWR